jgi:hypothetical protein
MANHEELVQFGIYLLQQENIRKSDNSGVEALTIDQIANRHAFTFVYGEEVTHVVTEEDLVTNPDLKEVVDEAGTPLQAGDEIKIAPITDEQLNEILGGDVNGEEAN